MSECQVNPACVPVATSCAGGPVTQAPARVPSGQLGESQQHACTAPDIPEPGAGDPLYGLAPGTPQDPCAYESLASRLASLDLREASASMVDILVLFQQLQAIMGRTASTLRAGALADKLNELRSAAQTVLSEAKDKFFGALSRSFSQAAGGGAQFKSALRSAGKGRQGALKSVQGETRLQAAANEGIPAIKQQMCRQAEALRTQGARLKESSDKWLARAHVAEAGGSSAATLTGAIYDKSAADDQHARSVHEANSASADQSLSEAVQLFQQILQMLTSALQTLQTVLQSRNQAERAVLHVG